jgi:hypothetical protein
MIKSRQMRWTRHVAHTGNMKNGYKILVGKLEGNRPLKKSKHKWEDNTKINL